MEKEIKQSGFEAVKVWVIIIGLIVSFNIFFLLLTTTLFPAGYDNIGICPEASERDELYQKQISLQAQNSCEAEGGKWYQNDYTAKNSMETYLYDDRLSLELRAQLREEIQLLGDDFEIESGSCDLLYECMQKEEVIREANSKKAFTLLLIVSIIALVVSLLGLLPTTLSLGLSLASIILLLISNIRYFEYTSDTLRLVLAGFVLALLVYFGIKTNKK